MELNVIQVAKIVFRYQTELSWCKLIALNIWRFEIIIIVVAFNKLTAKLEIKKNQSETNILLPKRKYVNKLNSRYTLYVM